MRSARHTAAILGLVAWLAVPAALAAAPRGAADPRDILVPGPPETSRAVVPEPGSKSGSAALRFLDEVGGEWTFFLDPRADRFRMIQGSGVPLVTAGAAGKAGPDLLAAVEPLVRGFLERHLELVGPSAGTLQLDPVASQVRLDGRLISIYYDWLVDGVPVEGATVFVRLNRGNVTQIGSRLVGPIEVPTRPAIGPKRAIANLLEYSGDQETARLADAPELVLQAEDGGPSGIAFRLVWTMRYTIQDRIETWEGRIDATTGKVVGFRDTNSYARAVGGVYLAGPADPAEVEVPLRDLDVLVAGALRLTDAAGAYVYSGGPASTMLNGRYFDIDCSNCENPASPSVATAVGDGRIDFGLGGADEVGNGFSTRAGRTTFFHLNRARRVALGWLPDLPYLQNLGLTANVNIQATCNASYNGAVNFFRSGAGCNNTGEIADVIVHEWGHGLDLNTQGGDGGTGEGTADVAAMHLSHSPLVGPGFRTDGSPVRDLDAKTSDRGLLTASRIEAGDCDFMGNPEVHCVGEIYGQAAWELAGVLAAKHGPRTGWRISERLFFTSLPDARSWNPTSSLSIYSAYLQADDDDGDLANGTPNGGEIWSVFSAHEMAGAEAVSSPGCERPAQPDVAVASACGALELTWNEVPDAVEYRVLRTEFLDDTAYLPVATLPAGNATWVDDQVAPGIDYRYAVLAIDAGGCESTVENPVPARLLEQPVLQIDAFRVDDSPLGNRSGFPDPGEDVDLVLTLTNHGVEAGTAISGTIEAETAGVEILEGFAAFPDLGPGESAANPTPLRFRTDPETPCGSSLRFRFVPHEETGCSGRVSWFDVVLGEPDGESRVCDDTPPCFTAPDFDGVGSVEPGASCAEVSLAWSPATSHCIDAEIRYNVYRSTDPAFVPGPANRVAEGFPGTSFTDILLEPGQEYAYVVRPVDSRSGEASSKVVRTVTAPTGPDLRAPLFAGVTRAGSGSECGETALSWEPALETCSGPVAYDIHRSTDPAFVPGPQNRIGSTFATSFIDVALDPVDAFTYVVRARDESGNVSSNGSRPTTQPLARDRIVARTDFEPDDGGWSITDPDTAETGNWRWGDPVGTSYQPEDDVTPGDGAKCWVTGIGPDPSNGDVDGGETTLLTAEYDLGDTVDPVVRYYRWFTNDKGASPAEFSDRLIVDITADGGQSWIPLEAVGGGTPLDWVPTEIPLGGLVPPGSTVRFRFKAADLGGGSLVEAAIDEFELADRAQGCSGCDAPVVPVETIGVSRSAGDVVVFWLEAPRPGRTHVVYSMEGETFGTPVRLGATDGPVFLHREAARSARSFFYLVSAVDACGVESGR